MASSRSLGTVSQLWRYAAKSMLGEELPSADLTASGLRGDRGWAIRDESNGSIRGAKKIGELMGFGARYLAPPSGESPTPHVEISFPDGTCGSSADTDINGRLSTALGREVTLWPLQPAADLDHYRRGAPDSDDFLEELQQIFGRLPDEPLPDLSVFPPEIMEYESPPGSYFDAFPLLIMTTTTLATLQRLVPDSNIDIRRFRPNIVVDTNTSDRTDDPWPEIGWVGSTITVGGARLEIVTPCPRCVMITRDFDDVPQDRSLMRAVVNQADQNLGVYAKVVGPATVDLGAAVALDPEK